MCGVWAETEAEGHSQAKDTGLEHLTGSDRLTGQPRDTRGGQCWLAVGGLCWEDHRVQWEL